MQVASAGQRSVAGRAGTAQSGLVAALDCCTTVEWRVLACKVPLTPKLPAKYASELILLIQTNTTESASVRADRHSLSRLGPTPAMCANVRGCSFGRAVQAGRHSFGHILAVETNQPEGQVNWALAHWLGLDP